MARTFPEPLDLEIPLRTTWEERWQLLDDDDQPIDLTGYQFRMQVRDRYSGELKLNIDSAGADPRAIITPAEGTIDIKVSAADVLGISPLYLKAKTLWDCELYIPVGAEPEYVIPVLTGSATFLPRQTKVLAP